VYPLDVAVDVHPAGTPPYQPPPVTERPVKFVNEPFVTLSVPAWVSDRQAKEVLRMATSMKRKLEFVRVLSFI
jgi:hypothetical protein